MVENSQFLRFKNHIFKVLILHKELYALCTFTFPALFGLFPSASFLQISPYFCDSHLFFHANSTFFIFHKNVMTPKFYLRERSSDFAHKAVFSEVSSSFYICVARKRSFRPQLEETSLFRVLCFYVDLIRSINFYIKN